jgi:hypothetical protein
MRTIREPARLREQAARLAATVTVALVVVVLTGTPALAHGSAPDASNFLSSVVGTVQLVDGEPAGQVDPPPGVTWRVLGADALLQVENTGDDDLVVPGYDGEPFLRVGPQGVFQNVRSPATYLNADRNGTGEIPPEADPRAAPEWRRVTTTPRWQWHDHRIHWMAPTRPPQVQRQPDVAQTVLEWQVPFGLAGQDLAVQGVLRWIPPGAAWPWLIGAAAVAALPGLVVLLVRRGRPGEHGGAPALRGVLRAAIIATAVVAVGGVVVAAGDVLATPASVGADVWAVAQTLLPAVLSVALAASLWRDDLSDAESRSTGSLLIATAILAIGCGVTRSAELRSSQIVNALPPWFVRAAIAASLTAIVPPLLMMLASARMPRPATLAPGSTEAEAS